MGPRGFLNSEDAAARERSDERSSGVRPSTLEEKLAAEVARSDEPRRATGLARLLVVDDDLMMRRCLERILGTRYEVAVAESAQEALDRIRDGEDFELVLTDIMMPGKSGLSLIATLEGERPELRNKFVVMTGGGLLPDGRELRRVASLPWVDKPFSMAELLTVVEKTLKSASSDANEDEP